MEVMCIRLPDISKHRADYSHMDNIAERLSNIPHSSRRELGWNSELLCREGVVRLLYDSGELRAEIPCRDYRGDGIARWFYKSALLEAEISYKNGLCHGIARWFPDALESKAVKYYFKRYYIRNREILGELYDKFHQGGMTLKETIDIKNVDFRGVLLGEIEAEKLFKEIPYIILDETEHEILVQPGVERTPINIVKVRCSSTGSYHFIRVPARIKRIQEAKAWTFGLTEKEYAPVKET